MDNGLVECDQCPWTGSEHEAGQWHEANVKAVRMREGLQ
ncbi:protein of unknown function [Nitrospira japonica]|uniref:Uncharacterized protein n=1 Tax=Nitrospira japonica TaxID=1325564 RepID=A0A1W1I466_9BACT|nr:protein of unknown function [Nitrospira japonica]